MTLKAIPTKYTKVSITMECVDVAADGTNDTEERQSVAAARPPSTTWSKLSKNSDPNFLKIEFKITQIYNFVPLECSIVTFHAHGIVQEYLVILFWHCLGVITSLLILYSNLCCNLLISTTMLPGACAKPSSIQ